MTDDNGSDGSTRAFVLGLDGVPWGMLRKWAERGDLPAFAELLETGAAGPLESTTPATTPLAWPSIATGTNADKHGIYGFQKLSRDGTHRMYSSDDLRQPALWERLSPSMVGNVPMTYPAPEIDGTLAAGMMAPGVNDRWGHPDSFLERVREEIPEYRIGLEWEQYGDRPEEFRAELADLLAARRKLMRLQMEREDWRLFFFVYTAPDRLQHLVWDEDVLLDHYEQLDDILGEVMAYADRFDAALYVVSDHGFGPVEQFVSVPLILERAGLLARRRDSGSRGRLARLGVTKDAVRSWLDRVGIEDRTLVDHLPESFVDRVAQEIPGDHALYDIDRTRTDAFVHGPGNVYVNAAERFTDGRVEPGDVASVKREVAELLADVRDPKTGERALVVHDGAELFPTDERSPDLVVKGRPGYESATSFNDDVFVDSDAKAANHRSEGVFFARGPEFEPGGAPTDASVVDVAPTLLHALGEPVPAEMDGRVLTETFADGSGPAERAVRIDDEDDATRRSRREESTDEEARDGVEDRLRGLGYID
ncbi:alkaline phosphatase family protein [Halorarum halobium]|uniref:alkaline phosphatase family protein n=1 Tax=Halorarum halobium TaxID=3075121 RepID=UPI0028A6114E|nr:alkaline phosphatase family protein [Halobaculum sp. XH14]